MNKLYVQTIFNKVDLIGGEEVGLPLPQEYLERNVDVLNIDITDLEIKPRLGWYYVDGKFYEADPRKSIPEKEVIVPLEPTNSEVMQIVNDLRAELEIAGVIV